MTSGKPSGNKYFVQLYSNISGTCSMGGRSFKQKFIKLYLKNSEQFQQFVFQCKNIMLQSKGTPRLIMKEKNSESWIVNCDTIFALLYENNMKVYN